MTPCRFCIASTAMTLVLLASLAWIVATRALIPLPPIDPAPCRVYQLYDLSQDDGHRVLFERWGEETTH